jgi:phosphatidylserine/phosphatidylglycerophosphate/cardiolipin synthase-like enzyme
MRSRILSGLVAVGLAAGSLVAGGVPTSLAGTRALTDHTTFSNPNTGENDDIVAEIEGLIGKAAKGSTIRVAHYHFSEPRVTTALAKAFSNGVTVNVVLSGNEKDNQDAKDLQTKLGRDPQGKSWLRFCPGKGGEDACIGSHIMHNKFFLFDQVEGGRSVIVQSSANLNEFSGTAMWNSSVTLVGHQGLYDAYHAYFNDLAAGDPEPDYFHGKGHQYRDDEFALSHSPRVDSTGNTWVEVLRDIKCTGNTSGGTSDDHRTIIRVANHAIEGHNGSLIADALWQKDQEGCYVDIVSTEIGHQDKPGDSPQPLEHLLKKPNGYHGPVVREFSAYKYKDGHRDGKRKQLHQKDLMIDGNYKQPNNKVVFTGTLNFNNKSNAANDESLLMIDNDQIHDAFVQQFLRIRTCANLDWQTSAQQNGNEPDHSPDCT